MSKLKKAKNMLIKRLKKEFTGIGQVRGFKYTQIYSIDVGFLYEVNQSDTLSHFEVFERKIVPLCIDFDNRVYSETDFKEIYPKENDFGVWAWTFKTLEKAYEKLNSLNKNTDEDILQKF